MVTIEVARMKEPDTFGRTHTAYVGGGSVTNGSKAQEENQPQEEVSGW